MVWCKPDSGDRVRDVQDFHHLCSEVSGVEGTEAPASGTAD